MHSESFEIDVGEVGPQGQWRPVPRLIHGRRDLRRVLNNLVELMLDETTVHVDVIYLRVRRMEQVIATAPHHGAGNPN